MRRPVLLFVALLVMFSACRESTKSAMMRIAKQRAAMNAAYEEEEKKKKAAEAAKEKASPAAKPTPPPPDTPAPATPASATPAPEGDAQVASSGQKPNIPQATKPGGNPQPKSTASVTRDSSAPVATTPESPPGALNPPAKSQPVSVAKEPANQLPLRDELLGFGPLGRQVAYTGSTSSVGIFDVTTRELIRQVYNPHLSPFSMAFSEDYTKLAVGGLDGTLKIFPLDSLDGLDKFQINRLKRQHASPPRKVHNSPVTAIAISEQSGGLVATGDASGELKLWSSNSQRPVQLSGVAAGYVQLQSYHQDQLVFATSQDNQLVFWRVGSRDDRDGARQFATFKARPTALVVGPEGKGLVVGDEDGRVTMWLPEGKDLKKVSFSAHTVPIAGLRFTADGRTLVTAGRTGEVVRWSLPVAAARSISVAEQPDFVKASPNGQIVAVPSQGSNLDLYSIDDGTPLRRHALQGKEITAAEFSDNSRIVAAGDSRGTVQFFSDAKTPIASTRLGSARIDSIQRSPLGTEYAYSLSDGTVGVATFPESNFTPLGASTADLAVMDKSGSQLLVIRGSRVQAVRADSGLIANEATVPGESISAAALEANLAILATKQGNLWIWQHLAEDAQPEMIAPAAHQSAIVAVSLTNSGRIWSCDQDGNNVLTPLAAQRRSAKGSLGVPVIETMALQSGQVMALGNDGQLRTSGSIGKPLQLVDAVQGEQFSSICGNRELVAAVASDRQSVRLISPTGELRGRLSVLQSEKPIRAVDAGGDTVAMAGSGSAVGIHLPASSGSVQPMVSGQLRQSFISVDGSVVLAESADGAIELLSGIGGTRKLDISAGSRLVALSPDGHLAVFATAGGASCFKIDGASPQLITAFPAEVGNPSSAVFTENSESVVFSCGDGAIFSAAISDATQVKRIGTCAPAGSIQFDKATKSLLCRTVEGKVAWLAADSGESMYESGDRSFGAVCFAGGNLILGDGQGNIFRIRKGDSAPSLIANISSAEITALTVDRGAGLIVAGTSIGTTHLVSVKAGVALELPSDEQFGRTPVLALRASGGRLSCVNQAAKVKQAGAAAIAALTTPDTTLKQISVSSSGDWIMANTNGGQLKRWNLADGKFSPAAPVAQQVAAQDVIRMVGEDTFCVVHADQSASIYAPAEDKMERPLGGQYRLAGAIASNSSRSVLLRSESGLVIADFRRSKIESASEPFSNLADSATFLPLPLKSGNQWAVIRSDGRYAVASQLTSKTSDAGFQLENPQNSAVLSGEMLVATSASGVAVLGEDGTQINQLLLSDAKATNLAISPSTNQVAICDDLHRLSILSDPGSQPLRVQLPIDNVVSMTWAQDGTTLAVTNGVQLVSLDGQSGAVVSQVRLVAAIDNLLHWSEKGICFLGSDGRLGRLRIPEIRWSSKLSGAASSIAWTPDSADAVVAMPAGSLVLLDAAVGREVTRIETGKGNLRNVVSIPGTGRMAMLAGSSDILFLDNSRRLHAWPIPSALGLRSICPSSDGRWLYSANDAGRVTAWDLNDSSAPAKAVPCDLDCNSLTVSDQQILASGSGEAELMLVSAGSAQQVVADLDKEISDFDMLPDGSFAVVADGSSIVQLVPLKETASRRLQAASVGIDDVSIHPTGARIAATGENFESSEHTLLVWDTVSGRQIATTDLPGSPQQVLYSPGGGLLAVSFEDGSSHIYDGTTGLLLESLPSVAELNVVAFTSDSKHLILGQQDGTMTIQPLRSLGVVQASESAIVSLNFYGAGKYILSGTMSGDMALWSRGSLAAPQAIFKGMAAAIVQSKVSPDGRYAVAVYDDPDHSTYVWKLRSGSGSSAAVDPELIVQSPIRTTSAAFTADSKFLMLGGTDGIIRAWGLTDKREVAKFQGHDGPVLDLAPLSENGRFVSGGADRSIRSWRFPSALPGPGAPIPDGALADATDMEHLKTPTLTDDVLSEDPLDAARQALISGTGSAPHMARVIELIGGDERAKNATKQSLARVMSLEKDSNASAEALSQERRRLSENRRRMSSPTEQAYNLSSYSDGFGNLTFVAPTNFKFGIDGEFRPVRLLFADRFIYAARTSVVRGGVVGENDEPIDRGDNGELLSWDYRYSQLQAHAWSIDELNVKEIFALPDSAGIFTVPQMMLFNQDGAYRRLSTVASWASSRFGQPESQLLAVGTAGTQRAESDILKVYDVAHLTNEKVSPLSQYRSFEGIVTAIAFSSNSSRIAFCVRERAVHRLFIADAKTLQVQQVDEFEHAKPWLKTSEDQRRGDAGAPGITSLAFSPKDDLLIAHGRYGEDLYRFSGWVIKDDGYGNVSTEIAFPPLQKKEAPFFVNSRIRSIWFIERPKKKNGDSSIPVSRKNAAPQILVQVPDGFAVINLGTGAIVRKIKFLTTQRGKPEYAISENGRWLMMGDDHGMAYVWDTLTGVQRNVAIDAESEALLRRGSGPVGELVERPAHAGPIVGVAFSAPDPGQNYPAFAATFGEENKLKVWELYSILGGDQSSRLRRSVSRSKR